MTNDWKHMTAAANKRKTPIAEIYANILAGIFLVALLCGLVYIFVEYSLPVMGYK